MKRILVIDGQGGRIGRQIIEEIRKSGIRAEINAVGTNSVATAAMLKAGADSAATGENPVIVCCRTADVIIGPVGIVIADSLLGEITPAMSVAVGQSEGRKLLIPVNHCQNVVIGVTELSLDYLIKKTLEYLIKEIFGDKEPCSDSR